MTTTGPESVRVAAVSDIPEGEGILIDRDITGTDDDIAVFHAEDGNFYALNNECTHGRASLAEGFVEGTCVECPLHSSQFDLATGKVSGLPATVDTVAHRVEVSGDDVIVFPTR